jgi:hypothetical protein
MLPPQNRSNENRQQHCGGCGHHDDSPPRERPRGNWTGCAIGDGVGLRSQVLQDTRGARIDPFFWRRRQISLHNVIYLLDIRFHDFPLSFEEARNMSFFKRIRARYKVTAMVPRDFPSIFAITASL